MNTPTRTIAVLVALNLLISGLTFAQDTVATEARKAEVTARENLKQAEMARKQVNAALRQLRSAKDAELAKSMVPPTPPGLPVARSTSSRSRWPFQSGATGPVLVIPSAEIETKDLLTINEDLNVMSRIFEANLQKARIAPLASGVFLDRRARSSLLNVLTHRGDDSIQSLYLQGYGILFLMKVDFPLSPPHQVQEQDETEKEEGGDEVWEDMRRRLYEPETLTKSKTDDSAEKYDAEKVENLKTALIEALKHASNIRNLKSEESVILTITGRGNSGDPTMIVTRVDGHNRIIREPASVAAGSPMVLVIRAKKADIDSFSNGDLDLGQFRQRVQVLSYPYLGGGSSQHSDLFHYNVLPTPRSSR
ncbi:MAG: hypothetical protein JSW59_17515 [Phycisphaerales bacterium]|nr:MAG: hypothetical protein JSW59_17515 [Phycisphaerales bacterium]